jgi:hypothetical protein
MAFDCFTRTVHCGDCKAGSDCFQNHCFDCCMLQLCGPNQTCAGPQGGSFVTCGDGGSCSPKSGLGNCTHVMVGNCECCVPQ